MCSLMAGYLECQLKERLLCAGCARHLGGVRAARVSLECLVVALARAALPRA